MRRDTFRIAAIRRKAAGTLAAATLLATGAPGAATADTDPFDRPVYYAGGGHLSSVTETTWRVDSPYGERAAIPTTSGRVESLAVGGDVVRSAYPCGFFGLTAGTGAVVFTTSAGETRTYTIYDGVIDSVTNHEFYGRWLDSQGNEGVFAAFGPPQDDGVYAPDCNVMYEVWVFVDGNPDPEAVLAHAQDQLPANHSPAAPQLQTPTDGYTFLPGQIQRFSVVAQDQDGDAYFGEIFVRRPENESFDPFWPTAVAESGQTATGTAPVPYETGTGYEWNARASDGRLEGPLSTETRTFSVG